MHGLKSKRSYETFEHDPIEKEEGIVKGYINSPGYTFKSGQAVYYPIWDQINCPPLLDMKTCPYCGSNIYKVNQKHYYCVFCCMNLDISVVKENGEWLDVRVSELALDIHIDKTTPEIMTLSTFELLYLLKAIRKERSETYGYMNTFYQARKQENINQFKQYEEITGKEYMYYTKKAFIVENIIRSRLGFVPDRITDAYLAKYLNYIKKDKRKPMIIRQERNEKNSKYLN